MTRSALKALLLRVGQVKKCGQDDVHCALRSDTPELSLRGAIRRGGHIAQRKLHRRVGPEARWRARLRSVVEVTDARKAQPQDVGRTTWFAGAFVGAQGFTSAG